MINDFLKKIVANKNDYPNGYLSIVNQLEEVNQTKDNLALIWKAYQLSKKSHKKQKRKSGEPYF